MSIAQARNLLRTVTAEQGRLDLRKSNRLTLRLHDVGVRIHLHVKGHAVGVVQIAGHKHQRIVGVIYPRSQQLPNFVFQQVHHGHSVRAAAQGLIQGERGAPFARVLIGDELQRTELHKKRLALLPLPAFPNQQVAQQIVVPVFHDALVQLLFGHHAPLLYSYPHLHALAQFAHLLKGVRQIVDVRGVRHLTRVQPIPEQTFAVHLFAFLHREPTLEFVQ